jgi:ubiquitin-activating enzyme E1
VVVIADDCLTYADVVQVARLCRTNNVGIVLAQSHGVYGRVATDFGEEFLITDADGEAPSEMTVESIQPDGLVVLFKNQKHNLQDGDTVLFQEIVES